METLLLTQGAFLLQVPVRVDYSDLYNLLAFFDGGVDEARTGNHDDLAEEIATAGADWASKNWRPEDMQACKIRLLLSPSGVATDCLFSLQMSTVFCSSGLACSIRSAKRDL